MGKIGRKEAKAKGELETNKQTNRGFYFQSGTPGALCMHNRTRASDSRSAILYVVSVDVMEGRKEATRCVPFKNSAKPDNGREFGMHFSRPSDTSRLEQTNV